MKNLLMNAICTFSILGYNDPRPNPILEPTSLATSADDQDKGLRHGKANATGNQIIHISSAGRNNVSFIFFFIDSLKPYGELR